MKPTINPTAKPTIKPKIELDTFLSFRPPTHGPTPVVTARVQDPNYVVMSSDVPDWVIVTNAPTPRPTRTVVKTNAPTPRPTRAPAKKNDSSRGTPPSLVAVGGEEINEYSCTADPCQEDTWCRSRYGSCGPGFIYCNKFSTWRSSCPVMAPRPTRPPTPRPTRDPVTASPAYVPFGKKPPEDELLPAQGAPSVAPVWPTLPGPTLPTIAGTSAAASKANFLTQSQAGTHSVEGSDDDEGGGLGSEDGPLLETGDRDRKENEEDEDTQTASNGDPPRQQLQPGMDQWIDFTERRRSSGEACLASDSSIFSGRFFSVATLLLFSWLFT